MRPGEWARKLAFRIGQHDTPEEVNLSDWREFAAALDIPARPLFSRMHEIAELLEAEVIGQLEKFRAEHFEDPAHASLVRTVQKRCRWLENQIGG